jgi:hypothetical protein
MFRTIRDEIGALVGLLRTAALLAVIGALYKEMRKPPGERTWEGRLLGVVPYDFRLPTIERLRNAYWNPSSERIFTDRPLGVGWAVNVPALLKQLGIAQRLGGRRARASSSTTRKAATTGRTGAA